MITLFNKYCEMQNGDNEVTSEEVSALSNRADELAKWLKEVKGAKK
jgi:hypothetical protein